MKIIKEGSVSTDLNVFAGAYANNREIIRAIRECVVAESDAANMYEKLVDTLKQTPIVNSNINIAIKTIQEIADEEKVHIGEFQKLLSLFSANEIDEYKKGVKEV